MFSIIALEFFKLEPEQNGYLMAFFGIVQMVNCGGVWLPRVRFLGSYQHNLVCSGRSGSCDRQDDCQVLGELAAASVRRGFCFGRTGSGTHTCTYAQTYRPNKQL